MNWVWSHRARHFPHHTGDVASHRPERVCLHLPLHKLLKDAMAAMTIATPVALAGARPTKATLSRRAVASRASTKAPVSVARGALQVRAAIALDYNAETPMTYNETGKWRENFDLAAWASEVRQVEKDLKAEIGEDDVDHLNKILTWANMFYYGGLAVLFATPFLTNAFAAIGGVNPIAAFMMSTSICARWTMVGHHVCHGGYNTAQSENGVVTGRFHRRTFFATPFLTNAFAAIGGVNPIAAFMMSTSICARWTMVGHHVCHGGYNTAQSENGVVTGRFHRRTFAKGVARRISDWMDWMMPEAWDVEHNHLHHYQVRTTPSPDHRSAIARAGAREATPSNHLVYSLLTSRGEKKKPKKTKAANLPPSSPLPLMTNSSVRPRTPISWSAT